MAPYWDAFGAWLLAQLSVMALIRDVVVLFGALWLAALVWAGIRFLRAWEGWPSRAALRSAAAGVLGPLTAWPVRELFGPMRADQEAQATPPPDVGGATDGVRPRDWWRAARDRLHGIDNDALSTWLLRGFSVVAIVISAWAALRLAPVLTREAPTANENGALLAYRVGLATVVALISLPLLFIRSWINERQTRTAERQVALAEKGHVTERIIKATELLGATHEEKRMVDGQPVSATASTIEVRLGAIYTLERVARESPDDHLTVMETFAAYVRQNHSPVVIPKTGCDSELTVLRPREDIVAVLSVISRRSQTQRDAELAARRVFRWRALPLSGCDLREIFVQEDASREDLREADLRHVNLSNARLLGADLSDVNLGNARLWRASLRGARISGGELKNAELWSADLVSADLWNAVLKMSDLSNADLRDAQLSSADLTGANLVDARLVALEPRDGEKPPGPVRGLSQSQIDCAFVDVAMEDQLAALGLALPSHCHPEALTSDAEIEAAWREWKKRRPWGEPS